MPVSSILRPWFNPQFSYLTYLGLGLSGRGLCRLLPFCPQHFPCKRRRAQKHRRNAEQYEHIPAVRQSGYYNNEEEISEAMKDGEIVGCLIFPSDFTKKLQQGQQAEVLLGSNAVNMGYGSTINLKGSEVLGTVSGADFVQMPACFFSCQ